MPIELSKMSFQELKQLEKDLAKALKDFEKRKKNEAIVAAMAAAKEHGFTLEDILEEVGKGKVSVPKYQHPTNPAVTWTGRGRPPKWFKEALKGGSDPEDLFIGESS